MEKYSRNLRSCLGELKPYVAGKGIGEIAKKYGFLPEEIVKLGSNENPYGPTPRVWDAIREVQMSIYPEQEEFIESVSRYTGYPGEEILVGAGLDGVMDTLTRLFLGDGDKAVIHTPTFSFYEIITRLCGANPIILKRRSEYGISTEVPEDAKFVFICSPNNPTGNSISEEVVLDIVESTSAIVFVDEAYVEFADQSLIGLVRRYENLVVGRTLSKAFALAGLRIGYAVAPEWIADQYKRAAPPFSITNISLAAGIAALDDVEFMERSVSKIRKERARIQGDISGAHPSQGNFLYIQTPDKSGIIAEKLLKMGIIVRDCKSFRDAGEYHIRLTVGTPDQNSKFLEAYGKIC